MVDKRVKSRVLIIFGPISRGALSAFIKRPYTPPEVIDLPEMGIDTAEVEHHRLDLYLEKLDFSRYFAICLCIHGGGSERVFKHLVDKCQRVGAIPLGVADSAYYISEKVVPEVNGLVRCLSDDLYKVLVDSLKDSV